MISLCLVMSDFILVKILYIFVYFFKFILFISLSFSFL